MCEQSDPNGMERFHSTTTNNLRDKEGVVIVFDVTQKQSFNEVDSWLNQAKLLGRRDVKLLLLGNMVDKKGKGERVISEEIARQKADKESLQYMEVSAVDGTGVRDAFVYIIREVLKKHYGEVADVDPFPDSKPEPPKDQPVSDSGAIKVTDDKPEKEEQKKNSCC